MLVDADLRRPRQHHLFDLENRAGLTDLLVGDVSDVEECLLETGIDGLRLLPCGSIPPNPSEVLDSKRMEVVLDQIKERVDLVILDSPPALAVTDPVALGRKVDGAILAIMARRTSHSLASRAYTALNDVGAAVLGVVLVGVKRAGRGYYYYYSTKAESRKRAKPGWFSWIARLQRRWRWTKRNQSSSLS